MRVSVLATWRPRPRDWAADDALPCWATAGFDDANGRFAERLAFGGHRLSSAPMRLMVSNAVSQQIERSQRVQKAAQASTSPAGPDRYQLANR